MESFNDPYFIEDDELAPEILSLRGSVGEGADNEPDDVEAADRAMRRASSYERPPAFDAVPVRYVDTEMVDGIKKMQEQNGLIPTGRMRADDDTHHALNNRVLEKPKGFGLLKYPYRGIATPVGSGKENRSADVVAVKRSLAALGYGREHPKDLPHDLIDDETRDAIVSFQADHDFRQDGWMGPGGETEKKLVEELAGLLARSRDAWLS